jgi:glycosyltransferase involved in cell wall biosynthesis
VYYNKKQLNLLFTADERSRSALKNYIQLLVEKHISIVIPNYNMAATIGQCLEAAYSSAYKNFEVVVVDDHSEDNSVEIIKQFPCKLICLESRSGTSRARNTGARNSRGDFIFFIDADCLLERDTLSVVNRTLSVNDHEIMIGGTYTKMPFDRTFYSIFQSVFVNYSETKNIENPDYIAAHAMIVDARTFKKSGGFPEDFMPIIEDIEFSHRLRRSGCRLVMNPDIQVRHIFNFTLLKSLRNAVRKSMYWNMYSLKNKDVFKDSGSASVELKTNVASYFLNIILIALFVLLGTTEFLYPVPPVFMLNIFINRKLLKVYYETGGILFGARAFIYYTMIYPVPIAIGTLRAVIKYLLSHRQIQTKGKVRS